MAKLRSPKSIEGAFTRAKDILGAERCAEILELSPSMIYKICDTEHASRLTMQRAMQLDLACKETTGETPLRNFYEENLGDASDGSQSSDEAIVHDTLLLNAAEGDLASLIAEIEYSHLKGKKKRLTSKERIIALNKAGKVKKALIQLEKDLNAGLDNGAERK